MTNREKAFNIVGDYTPLHTAIERALDEIEAHGFENGHRCGREAGLEEAAKICEWDRHYALVAAKDIRDAIKKESLK